MEQQQTPESRAVPPDQWRVRQSRQTMSGEHVVLGIDPATGKVMAAGQDGAA